MAAELPVTGTDVWYYFICKRECWLMMHKIAPDEEDDNVELGRFLHEYKFGRGKKEVSVESVQMDRVRTIGGEIVVQEMKKSAKFKESARFQLLYYLQTLRKMGVSARGELKFIEEHESEPVQLTEEAEAKLEQALADIRRIARLPVPPAPVKIRFCGKCAYREYCWAEEA